MNLHQTLPRDTAMLNVNVRKKIDFWPVQKPAILLNTSEQSSNSISDQLTSWICTSSSTTN
ncbi:hypothetical protein BT96DRAFT_343501 [Gymnopus androsaceus JB14]|uniref:Uncharacterized protein n=1 Tax=Gymnopus androsaceus JB14 TaxID=1447944 RepID=A0A6A4GYF4_9AGAR|nr:hypothetical protein BT96DRAFT_343501 [Gymnopus androsaceus JB14]